MSEEIKTLRTKVKNIDLAHARVHGYGDLVDEIVNFEHDLALVTKERDELREKLKTPRTDHLATRRAYAIALEHSDRAVKELVAVVEQKERELTLVTKERDELWEKLKAAQDALFDLSYRHRNCALKTEA